jgi:purine-binding chemotaxis protein CheW
VSRGGEAVQYCTFAVGDMVFGVEVERVQEAIRFQAMTPVPLAPSVVGGLLNLRGQIVTAIDLRTRLGLPDRADGASPMNVVVRTADGVVSLLVDEIGDVLEVDGTGFEPIPETVVAEGAELIIGAHTLSGFLLLVLDVDSTVAPVAESA